MKNVLYITIGPSGSGKSTMVSQFMKPNTTIVSTDAIRGELFGDENEQTNGALVFAIAKERAHNALLEGKNVVFDATNCIRKYRKQLAVDIKGGLDIETVALIKMTPLSVCKERNAKRERKVPEDVIERQYNNFISDFPASYDGEFDRILFNYE